MANRAGSSQRCLGQIIGLCGLMSVASACLLPATESTSISNAAVVLVGDSLAVEAAQFLPTLVEPSPFASYVFGGTAPCDWLTTDLQLTADSVLVISFIGNSGTACMADGAGGFLQGQAILDKYRTDVSALIELARSAGARVLLVGQPPRIDSAQSNEVVGGLNAIYTELVTGEGIAFVDAGAVIENPDGTYAALLPCLPNEPLCDASGSNAVRSDDGLHLCPGPAAPPPCQVYSSGAFRFAEAIADAIRV